MPIDNQYNVNGHTTLNMRFIILLISIGICVSMRAQSWESICNNREYICGQGFGATIEEADKNALADLSRNITVHVSSNFDVIEEEKNNDNNTYVSNRVHTYSHATLNNTKRIILHNEPNAHVGRWMLRSEVEKIFEAREIKAKDLVKTALRAEEMGKVDDALRNYYWAYSLVRSLQHPNNARYTTEDGESQILMTWIIEQINDVLDNIQITEKSRKNDDVILSIKYKGRPVTSIDYTFYDGRDWSNIYSGKDGLGVLELAKGYESEKYHLKIEYAYIGESRIDKEIESVLSVVRDADFRKASKLVQAAKSYDTPIVQTENDNMPFGTDTHLSIPTEVKETDNYKKIIRTVLNSIISTQYNAPQSVFTPEAFNVYTALLKYGDAKVISDTSLKYYESSDGVMARGIKMSFSFKNGIRKAFVEDVIFYFNKENKICNITFGLGDMAEKDILYKGVWSENARKAIMAFLENYKTAYALKRLDYIETIFDDDAVIVVANVAKREQISDGNIYKNDIIKYNRKTKDQYLKDLSKCFNTNEYINIRFANNDVLKMGKGGETYSIQISQDYYSSSYGDKGYLFLMVDVNDPKQPIIRVRTWQPEKDPNFGLYGPGDFK